LATGLLFTPQLRTTGKKTIELTFKGNFYQYSLDNRCKIPGLDNDTYEIWNSAHQELVNKHVPLNKENAYKDAYNRCFIKSYLNDTSENGTDFKLEKCVEWVYSKKYFDSTLATKVSLVSK
jgi:OCT family organic cation transporter-like MFS transporter 4/5